VTRSSSQAHTRRQAEQVPPHPVDPAQETPRGVSIMLVRAARASKWSRSIDLGRRSLTVLPRQMDKRWRLQSLPRLVSSLANLFVFRGQGQQIVGQLDHLPPLL